MYTSDLTLAKNAGAGPQFFIEVNPSDTENPTGNAQANLQDDPFNDLDAWLAATLDPILDLIQPDATLPPAANVLFMWWAGWTDTPYSAGTGTDGSPVLISPLNHALHEAAVGGTSYLDQIAPAFLSRRGRIKSLVMYGGPLHAASASSNAALDELTEIPEAVNATPAYDVRNGLDFLLTPKQRLAEERYLARTGRKSIGEGFRLVTQPKLDGWDALSDGALMIANDAESQFADPLYRSPRSLRGLRQRAIAYQNGSGTAAARLVKLNTWMGRGADFSTPLAGLTPPQQQSFIAAARGYGDPGATLRPSAATS